MPWGSGGADVDLDNAHLGKGRWIRRPFVELIVTGHLLVARPGLRHWVRVVAVC
jgi:hypothetical protein